MERIIQRDVSKIKAKFSNSSHTSKLPPYNTLFLYLAVSNSVVSSVLIYEEGKKQHPVYVTSRTLQPSEEQYQTIEKLVLGLVSFTRSLRHYFKSFEITIRTDYPIK